MADGEVPSLILGMGSPKPAQVSPGIISGHVCVIGSPESNAAIAADFTNWASRLKAGTIAIDLDGNLTALLVERADSGKLGNVDVRVLSPSSPVGIPVSFRPLSGLSNPTHTEPWKRLRAWLPQLMATLADVGPGDPEHDSVAGYFLRLLDDAKESNPSILTVQGLVAGVKEALAKGDAPITPEAAQGLEKDLADLAEDLRNAALSYGAPVDLRRLLETPVAPVDAEEAPKRHHIDVVLLDHMTSVADRNSVITAILLEAYAWSAISGKTGRLLLVLPEVESPAAFLQTRPLAQRLTSRILSASKGTGLLGIVVPVAFDDPMGLPRFGAILLEKAALDRESEDVETLLKDQQMDPQAWGRMGMLAPSEWALAAGKGWSKWHRFTPAPEAVTERVLDTDALARLLPPEVRDVFSHKPEEDEEEVEEDDEGDEASSEAREVARAARAVEDAEDLLSYTTERKPQRAESRIREEVQELLKRKLEEKERAKEAQKFELKEIDLVDGEEPSDLEVSAHAPRPLSEGIIDDHSATGADGAPGVHLHADDLQVELAVLEAREAEEARHGKDGNGPDVVVDLDKKATGWESVTPEVALGAEDLLEEAPKTKGKATDEDEDEIIVELEDD
jgi:hypothetical protein